MGVGRRDLDGTSRKERGARGASPPSWSNTPTKGFPRHQTNPTIPRPSPQLTRAARSSREEQARKRKGTGLQIWRRGPLTPPSHRDQNPPRSRRPRDQERRPAPTDVTSRRSTPPLHPGPPPWRPNSPDQTNQGSQAAPITPKPTAPDRQDNHPQPPKRHDLEARSTDPPHKNACSADLAQPGDRSMGRGASAPHTRADRRRWVSATPRP
jgi:hypothetical protein